MKNQIEAKVTKEQIGPEMAKKLLANLYDEQRPIRTGYVDRLAAEMRNDTWRLSPDCLALIKGKLGNGQHRLRAVCVSQTTQPFLVMRTDDEQLFKVMDCGRPRTVADVLHGSHAHAIATTARWIVAYDLGTLTPWSNGQGETSTLTRSMCIEFAEENRERILQHVTFCASLFGKFKILQPTQTAALAFLGIRDCRKPEMVNQFIMNVYDGESSEDAARDLRERLIRSRAGVSRLSRNYVFALLVKSLRSYMNGTRLGTVRINEGEEFPRLNV